MLVFAAGLTGCSWIGGFGQERSTRESRQLYTAAFDKITHYYIEPVNAQSLSMAGLAKLTSLDSDIAVKPEGGRLTLLHAGKPLTEFMTPAPDDNDGWGNLTAAALESARAASPKIAATSTEDLDKTVLDGVVGTLDRFSRYAAPMAAQDIRAERNGFEGIGVTLDADESVVRVLSVIPGGPAESAGIEANDLILAIDGAKVAAMSREEVINRLRGAPGSHVTISIQRTATSEPIVLSIARAHIVLPTVATHREGGVAVFRLSSFNQDSGNELFNAVKDAHDDPDHKLSGIVLDLRDDPGGLVDQSVAVASLFLSGGTVVSTRGRAEGSQQQFPVLPSHLTDGIPMVVLVNGGSASASEIVAAALQDTGRAVVIGTSSYGKGTVQDVFDDLPNEGELTITWARLIPPGGYILHEHGVVPSICTSGLSDDADAIARVIEQGTSQATGIAARPRAALDEPGWQSLRQTCPPERADRAADLKIAERLFADPALYGRALASIPSTPARMAAAPPTP